LYQQSIQLKFTDVAPHVERLVLIAALAQRHPKHFRYSMEYSALGHECVLTALAPDVWDDLVAKVQPAQATGVLQVMSPKSIASSA
jgi:hypothetical protein